MSSHDSLNNATSVCFFRVSTENFLSTFIYGEFLISFCAGIKQSMCSGVTKGGGRKGGSRREVARVVALSAAQGFLGRGHGSFLRPLSSTLLSSLASSLPSY